MAGLTSDQLNTELVELIAARTAILGGAQSYQVNGRQVNRANLAEINRRIIELDRTLRKRSDRTGGTARVHFHNV